MDDMWSKMAAVYPPSLYLNQPNKVIFLKNEGSKEQNVFHTFDSFFFEESIGYRIMNWNIEVSDDCLK